MNAKSITRIIAILLFASGAWTAVLLFLSASRFAPNRFLFPVGAIPLLLFWLAVSAAGFWLWRGGKYSRMIASVLLASQIPVVMVGNVTYWWHTPAQLAITLQRVAGDILLGAMGKLGPGLSFWIGRPNASQTIGLNVVAVVALILLLRSGKSSALGRRG